MTLAQPLKAIPIAEAVGAVLGHDVTRIVPGAFKGPAFRKGHIIREQDIPHFRDIGKEHVYVFELTDGMLHEDEAAERIALAAAGPGVRLSAPSEGRVNFVAGHDGLLKVEVDVLRQVNDLEDIVFATLHGNHRVAAGEPVAGTRIVPLVIAEKKIREVETRCAGGAALVQVLPFRPTDVGMVTTGSEVYHNRIEDKFGPVVKQKFRQLGSRVIRQILVDDDVDRTVAAIHTLIAEGAQMVVLTGGMSVDPDDRTPAAIRATGAEVVTHGAPTFPGAMFMLAYLDDIPLLGLPGCVMYYRSSVFDLVVPSLLAGDRLLRTDITAMGHGGFCAGCDVCRYPKCGFGKA